MDNDLFFNHQENNPYEDIILLPRPVSKTHPPMSLHDRAAQFSPFAALTGFGASIQETARRTEDKVELDEDTKQALDLRFQELYNAFLLFKKAGSETASEKNASSPARRLPPYIRLQYFQKDSQKSGGMYCPCTGYLSKIDLNTRTLTLCAEPYLKQSTPICIAMDDIKELDYFYEQEQSPGFIDSMTPFL